MKLHHVLGFILLAFVVACNSKHEVVVVAPLGEAPTSEEVERIYQLYLDGRYEEYVSEMQSCDKQPEGYRQQMADLHKMHAHQQREKNGGALSAKVVRIEATTTGKQANAFLRVEYRNRTHETILLSLIRDDTRWRLE